MRSMESFSGWPRKQVVLQTQQRMLMPRFYSRRLWRPADSHFICCQKAAERSLPMSDLNQSLIDCRKTFEGWQVSMGAFPVVTSVASNYSAPTMQAQWEGFQEAWQIAWATSERHVNNESHVSLGDSKGGMGMVNETLIDYIKMRLAQIASGDYKICGHTAEDVAKDALAYIKQHQAERLEEQLAQREMLDNIDEYC